jgi:acyl dehydratase
MTQQRERLWDFDAVRPGQAGRPTHVLLTPEKISQYAKVSQNMDPRYHRAGVNTEYGGVLMPMPSMVLSYAPLLRDDIAENNGMVALEQSKTDRRQTPFAKCEIRWFGPVQSGDAIAGTRRVVEKYERRDNQFVVFRVEAANQRGEKVAEYEYTCIFKYAGGQRPPPPPADPSASGLQRLSPGSTTAPQRFLTFDELNVGDALTPLTLSESQEIINRRNDFRLAGKPSPSNIHTDEEFARRNIFGGTVNAGPATMSYVDQMLGRSFPLQAFYEGGRLLMRAVSPFRAGDRVTFQGEVASKRVDGRRGVVECQVKGMNQRGELVCLAEATLVLPQ